MANRVLDFTFKNFDITILTPRRKTMALFNGNLQRYGKEFMKSISRWGLGG
jgi:hypothetical protein